MKSDPTAWRTFLPAFEAEQWDECARLVRSWVDEDPYDLTSRALLASLYTRAASPELARLQYERLLPMVVGRGEVLWALYTQKQLDAQSGESPEQAQRYLAIQEWFRQLPAGARKAKRDRETIFSAAKLIALPGDRFAEVAQAATLHDLGIARHNVSTENGLLWFVCYGRLRWGAAAAQDERAERVAEAGDFMWVRAGDTPQGIELVPEIPTECMGLDASLAGGSDAKVVSAHPAFRRPTPDPTLEPTFAVGGPHERRRKTRVAIAIESKVAFLGEVGTRVSPMHGRLVDLSPGGFGVTFPAAQLRQVRGVHADAILPVKLSFRGTGEPIEVAARVAWIRKGHLDEVGEARMGLEFVSLSPANRSRLMYILDEAARSGLSF